MVQVLYRQNCEKYFYCFAKTDSIVNSTCSAILAQIQNPLAIYTYHKLAVKCTLWHVGSTRRLFQILIRENPYRWIDALLF
jgi:hypothetical protein